MAIALLATEAEVKSWLGLSTLTAQESTILGVIRPGVQQLINDLLGFSPAQGTYTEYYPEAANTRTRSEFIDGWERSGTDKVVPVERYVSERRALNLRRPPIRSITSVYENPDAWLTAGGDWPASTQLTEGPDYFLDRLASGISWTGQLIRNTGPWTVAERCVKVTYVAGFSDAELTDDYPVFRMAYFQAVQIAWNAVRMHLAGTASGGMAGGVGAITAEHIDSWGVNYDTESNARLYGMSQRLPQSVARMLEPYCDLGRYF